MTFDRTDDRIQQVFISLLRSGLWDHTIDLSNSFALSEAEWFVLYQLSISQTVEGLVFEAISKFPVSYQPPKALMLKWVVRIDAIERDNIKKKKITAEIVAFLKSQNVDVTLLKGSSLALYYSKPLLRLSGDVDLYFDEIEVFRKANRLMRHLELNVEIGALNSRFYIWKGCEIEHHSNLTDIVNPFCRNYLRKLEKGEKKHQISMHLNEMEIRTPSLLMTHIQVNAHIIKHFMGFGIGLRQFCDVARLYYHTSGTLNGEQLKLIYKKLGIFRWMELIHAFLIDQLGLNSEFLPYPIQQREESNWLMADVIRVGNFGVHSRIDKRILGSAIPARLLLAHKYAPYEAFWFPFSKVCSALSKIGKI